jgi:pterin-4a-carbinolamine dehydratase
MARLNEEEIERLADREGWERSGDAIVKQFDNGDFKGSVDFVNRLTPEAEEMTITPTSRSRGRPSP